MENGQCRVDGLDLLTLLREDGAGIELSTKKDGQVFGGALVNAAIDLRNCRGCQRFGAGIRNDADDRGPDRLGRGQHPTVIEVQTDTFANWVLIWPVGVSRGLIDDGNLGRILKVLIGEKASALERHA